MCQTLTLRAPRGHDHHLHHRLLFCLLARHQGVCHLPRSTQFYQDLPRSPVKIRWMICTCDDFVWFYDATHGRHGWSSILFGLLCDVLSLFTIASIASLSTLFLQFVSEVSEFVNELVNELLSELLFSYFVGFCVGFCHVFRPSTQWSKVWWTLSTASKRRSSPTNRASRPRPSRHEDFHDRDAWWYHVYLTVLRCFNMF